VPRLLAGNLASSGTADHSWHLAIYDKRYLRTCQAAANDLHLPKHSSARTIKAVENAVALRKGTYIQPESVSEPVVTLSGFPPTVSLVIGNPSLYKGEEILEEDLNMGPTASASVQT
jgi:hypothetical protein